MHCETQEEIDYYWEKLTEGGDEKAQVCGWLKDKFGVSWQIIPANLNEMITDPDPAKSERVMKALLRRNPKSICKRYSEPMRDREGCLHGSLFMLACSLSI